MTIPSELTKLKHILVTTLALLPLVATSVYSAQLCAAQPIAKLPYSGYEQRFMKLVPPALLSLSPSSVERFQGYAGRTYSNEYKPRTLVCVTETEQEFAEAISTPAYGGALYILHAGKRLPLTYSDGPLGVNNGSLLLVLGELRETVQLNVTKMQARVDQCGSSKSKFCQQDRNLLKKAKSGLATIEDAQTKIKLEPPAGRATTWFLAEEPSSIGEFYETVAALSYIGLATANSILLTQRIGSTDTTVPHEIYLPTALRPAHAYSLLDFVDRVAVLKMQEYHEATFRILISNVGSMIPKSIDINELSKADPPLQPEPEKSGIGRAFANHLCSLSAQNLPHRALSTHSNTAYLAAYRALFCEYYRNGQSIVLNVASSLQLDTNLSAALSVASTESLGIEINSSLLELQAQTLNQTTVLSELLKYTASTYYENKLTALEIRHAAAREAAKPLTGIDALSGIADIGAGLAGIGGITEGLRSIKTILGATPLSNIIGHLEGNREGLYQAAEKVGKGTAAVDKAVKFLEQEGKRSEAQSLMKALESEMIAVRADLDDVMSRLRAASLVSQEVYHKIAQKLSELERQKQGQFPFVLMAINRAVVQDLFSAWLLRLDERIPSMCLRESTLIGRSNPHVNAVAIQVSCGASSHVINSWRSCVSSSASAPSQATTLMAPFGLIVDTGRSAGSCLTRQ